METAENWYALSLSIIGNLTPEKALQWIEEGNLTKREWNKMEKSIQNLNKAKPRTPKPATKEEVIERKLEREQEIKTMAEMRQNGMKYTEIARVFNLDKSYIRKKIVQYERENP